MMGQLIELQPYRTERERALAEAQDAAGAAREAEARRGRVLLFTGVRYERMEAEPARGLG